MMKMATVLTLSLCVCLSARSQDSLSLNNGNFIKEISLTPASASVPDTVPFRRHLDWSIPDYRKPFPVGSFVLPAAMVAYGFTAIHVSGLQHVNSKIKEEIWTEDPHRPIHA